MVPGRDAVHPGVRVPALLGPVRRKLRLEPGRGLRRLSGRTIERYLLLNLFSVDLTYSSRSFVALAHPFRFFD